MAEDAIDRLLKLSPDEQRSMVDRLPPDQIKVVLGKVRERKALKTKGPSGPPSPQLLANRKAVSKSEFESNLPESTIGSRTREAAIGALEPFTAGAVADTAKTVGTAGYDILSGNLQKGIPEAWNVLKGLVSAPVAPLVNIEEGFRTGDYDRAAYGAGGFLSQTAPALAGVGDATARALGSKPIRVGPEIPKVGDLKTKARSIAQRATGTTAADTTGKAFKDYSEKAAEVPEKQRVAAEEAATKTKEQQAAENTKVSEQNRTKAIAARAKNESVQQKYQSEVKTAGEEAEGKTKEQEAQFEKTQQFQIDSKRLGEQTADLNEKLRAESNENYDPVNKATAADEGETLTQQAIDARNLLKGSPENIKQFIEVLRGQEAEGEAFRSEVEKPYDQAAGHPLARILQGEDPLTKEQIKYKFDDIQGFKQELDEKLGSGTLLPDVYNALRSFRNSLDAAAKTIAERNGVGDQLANANKFYADWKTLFEDNSRNKSALGEVLNRATKRKYKTDPEFYHEPFTKGNASGVAIDRLRGLKTKYAADAQRLADLANQLRTRYNTGEKPSNYLGEKPSTVVSKDVVPPTPVGTRPAAPKTVPPVEPKEVAIPEEPNVKDLVKERAEAVGKKGRGMQQISAYDLRRLGLPVLGGLVSGHPLAGLVTGLGIEGLTKGIGYALDVEKIKNFIAAPTEADITAAEQLPEPARTNVIKGLRDIIAQEQAAGRQMKVNSKVRRLIGAARNTNVNPAIVTSPVTNRREAMERLGR